jgi:protein-tyrosine-phosphatase
MIADGGRARRRERAAMAKDNKTKVLFVCIGNMIRSQMAEGFARHSAGAFVAAYSAGVRHTGSVSEEAAHVMAEKGIDIHRQYSKGLGDVPFEEMDYIVNMSGYPNEKVFPAALPARFITWQVNDPLGGNMDRFRRVRDEIEAKVDDLLRAVWSEASKKAKSS